MAGQEKGNLVGDGWEDDGEGDMKRAARWKGLLIIMAAVSDFGARETLVATISLE